MKLKNFSLKQIADSGQVFRFTEISDGVFDVRSLDKRLIIKNGEEIIDPYWKNYFDLDTDYSRFIKAVPKEDDYLTRAARFSEGVRILNQDPWEMLISFIISQRKSIPAIRTSIEKLCEKFGTLKKDKNGEWYAFPTPAQLAEASMDDILACSVGYRAEYISLAANAALRKEIDLEACKSLSDEGLKEELLRLKGVGEKVANCVMLFGFHRIGAFPVDVWIKRVLDEHYDGEFPMEKYEGFAGIMQQYMFFYAKSIAHLD